MKGKGRETLNDENTINMLRSRLMVGNVIRSLGSGGGNIHVYQDGAPGSGGISYQRRRRCAAFSVLMSINRIKQEIAK